MNQISLLNSSDFLHLKLAIYYKEKEKKKLQ